MLSTYSTWAVRIKPELSSIVVTAPVWSNRFSYFWVPAWLLFQFPFVVFTRAEASVCLCHCCPTGSKMLYEWIEYLWLGNAVVWGRHWGAAVNGRPVSALDPLLRNNTKRQHGIVKREPPWNSGQNLLALRVKSHQALLYKWVSNHLFVCLCAHVNLLGGNIKICVCCKGNSKRLLENCEAVGPEINDEKN